MSGDLSQVASQYAEAVIEIIEESHKGPDAIKALERVHGDLKVIAEIFDSNEDFSLVLNHPNLSPEDKKNLLLKTFEGRVDPVTLRLLKLLAERRRLEVLPYLEGPFKTILRERLNVVGAVLTCAQKLSDSQIQDIKARLTEHLGKKLELDVEVDPSLIGGMILRLGDQVIDGSLKGKLQVVEKSLMSV